MEYEEKTISTWKEFFKRGFNKSVFYCCCISIGISIPNILSSFAQVGIAYGIGSLLGAILMGCLLAAILGMIYATIRKIIGQPITVKVEKEDTDSDED